MIKEDAELGAERRSRLVAGEVLPEYEITFRTKQGETRRILWKTVNEDDAIYAFGRDITAEHEAAEALRQAEEALRQSQKMEAVGQLTGGIAHDFNNLLTGIIGSLELLQRANRAGAAQRRRPLPHRRPGRRQARGGPDPSPSRLLAPADARSQADRRQSPGGRHDGAGAAHRRALDRDRDRRRGRPMAHPGRPRPARERAPEPCINARDAMPDGGRITIETANRWMDRGAAATHGLPPGQYISLCVSDTGTGMPPEVIARAFDPFFTTKPIGQGTGLGLSMIYGFARQSGGHVRIYSEVGQGTMVCIYLPRHHGPAEEVAEMPRLAGAAARRGRARPSSSSMTSPASACW